MAGRRWEQWELDLLGTAPDWEVAVLLPGRTVNAVTYARRSQGIILRQQSPPRSWTDAEIPLLGTMPDGKLAKRLRRSRSSVAEMRVKLNRPAYGRRHWGRDADRHCALCNAPIYPNNRYGICSSNPQCSRVRRRVANGETVEAALSRPVSPTVVTERCRVCGREFVLAMHGGTGPPICSGNPRCRYVRERVARRGWSLDRALATPIKRRAKPKK